MKRPHHHPFILFLFLVFVALDAVGEADRPDDEPAPSDSARVERGQYLVEGLLQCMICHSERDWEKPGAPPVAGSKGAGRVVESDGEYRLVAPNLTPDVETGTGEWSDEQLIRAIRRGVGHDGRPLYPLMYYDKYRHLTDGDVRAVVAYLRSLPPIRNPLPPTRLSPEQRERAESRSPATLAPIDLASLESVERGRALVIFGDCIGCHTAWSPRRAPELAGGNLIVRGEKSAFSTNLTPHPSGAAYDVETFIEVIRTGKHGTLHPLMPWVVFSKLSDSDLRDIHAFLQTRYPVAHFVDNQAEPTQCPICGQQHGLGKFNDANWPEGITVDPANYKRYTGTYVQTSKPHNELSVRVGDSGLVVHLGNNPPVETVLVSPDRMLVPGVLRSPLRFEFDENSRAARVIYESIEPWVFQRAQPTAGDQEQSGQP